MKVSNKSILDLLSPSLFLDVEVMNSPLWSSAMHSLTKVYLCVYSLEKIRLGKDFGFWWEMATIWSW